jgi:catechol 2,3-dioxygenase-like lactoylglutathione lyase family enzyme
MIASLLMPPLYTAAAAAVLDEWESILDAHGGAPQHHDQTADTSPVDPVPGLAHDRHDLLDGRRIGRVADPLVARRAPGEIPGQGGRRQTAPGGLQQRRHGTWAPLSVDDWPGRELHKPAAGNGADRLTGRLPVVHKRRSDPDADRRGIGQLDLVQRETAPSVERDARSSHSNTERCVERSGANAHPIGSQLRGLGSLATCSGAATASATIPAVIAGAHTIIFAEDAERAREFLRDVLGFEGIDAGEGWLIFAMPPGEVAVHPGSGWGRGPGHHALFLMCHDIERTVEDLERKGVEFVSAIEDEGWGRIAQFKIPGAGEIGVYEPRHLSPLPEFARSG